MVMENDQFLLFINHLSRSCNNNQLDLWCVISGSNILVNALSAFLIPQNNSNTGMRLPVYYEIINNSHSHAYYVVRMVLEENSNGKRPLGRPRRRWEDGVRDDVKALGGGEDWRLQASNRENWRQGCMSGWS
ncbi:uncharacterized protein LOC112693728 [Sipha flava]|uniref:Uncharacterized protein LOC112693728 n=1 Tax=Sipha flava TaxID=143950 RepID=A0A8B8GN72_9HEMI|nr:uncharacterized protein LOC112693728 [Sipha flava]